MKYILILLWSKFVLANYCDENYFQSLSSDQILKSSEWFEIKNRNELKKILESAQIAIKNPQQIQTRCGEKILTYFMEISTNDTELDLILNLLGIRNTYQIQLAKNYKILFLEGTQKFSETYLKLKAAINFFGIISPYISLKHEKKGCYVYILHRGENPNHFAITHIFNSGSTLESQAIVHMFIKFDKHERDSIDNHKYLPIDAFLPSFIHESAHALFETKNKIKNTPIQFQMIASSKSIDQGLGQPEKFWNTISLPEARQNSSLTSSKKADLWKQIQIYYAETQLHVRDPLKTFNLLDPFSSQFLYKNLPQTKARIYGAIDAMEDWGTTFESYFYNNMELLLTANLRRSEFPDRFGLTNRFKYMAEAFSVPIGRNRRKTKLFKISDNIIHSREAILVYSDKNILQEVIPQ